MTKINNSRVSIKTKILLPDNMEVAIKHLCNFTALKSVKGKSLLLKEKLTTADPYMVRLKAHKHTLECSVDTLIAKSPCQWDIEWTEAEKINVGDTILMSDGRYEIESVEVLCVTKYGSVYSLYTEHGDDTCFANGFAIKHNIVEVEDEEE